MITEENLYEWDLPTKYKIYTTKITEYAMKNEPEDIETYKKLKENYNSIRFGIKHKFDIYDIISDNYSEKAKDGYAYIRKTQEIQFEELFTEMEKRESLITALILLTIKEEDAYEPET